MGKHIIIDHREAPPAAKIPMVVRNGIGVPANPEPEVPTDEVVQLRQKTEQQRGKIEALNQQVRIKTAETKALKRSLQDARDEAANLRYQRQQPELEGHMPARIEIATIDDIERQDDIVSLKVLADVDGTVGETEVQLSFQQLKLIIKAKRQEQQNEQ